ncbi:retrovirus-related pol polyprotein from transposon TNT 1-94, partial [Tanacetum coccineum]
MTVSIRQTSSMKFCSSSRALRMFIEQSHDEHSKLNANSELKCVKCNGCMLSDNHDLCVLDFINNVNARTKSKSVKKNSKRKVWKPTGKVFTNIGYTWRPTGRTFTIVGNVCPLTRITTTTEVPLRKPTALENETSKPVVTLVYPRKSRKSKTNVPVKAKSKVGTPNFKFENDHVAKILGYGDYQIENVTISRVYNVEGLGYNLFSVGQLKWISNLELAFRRTQPASFVSEDLCGPMRVASVNGKKYILVIVDDYSRFTWVKCLRSKDEAPDSIIKFLKDDPSGGLNCLVGISHETSIARSLQQNGVVERHNRTLIEAARTMLIYAKAPLMGRS